SGAPAARVELGCALRRAARTRRGFGGECGAKYRPLYSSTALVPAGALDRGASESNIGTFTFSSGSAAVGVAAIGTRMSFPALRRHAVSAAATRVGAQLAIGPELADVVEMLVLHAKEVPLVATGIGARASARCGCVVRHGAPRTV